MSHSYAYDTEPVEYDEDEEYEYNESDSEFIETPDVRLRNFMNTNRDPYHLSSNRRHEFNTIVSEYRKFIDDCEIPYDSEFERKISRYSRIVWFTAPSHPL